MEWTVWGFSGEIAELALRRLIGELLEMTNEVPEDDMNALKSAQGRVVLYESLQLAHKCILNSFYGYVMRKGFFSLIFLQRLHPSFVCLNNLKVRV
ncbi:unnamed protein product [Toxocara canis]|uniref:DNA polymerase epsilon catalytic subunit n=1 Tax=Toxocara canis TaxID=6265 RepID=A0A183U888_TOXCA|nr:unnamed protein product [Toxocara canis]